VNLPSTKRVGYIELTLRELSDIINGKIKLPWDDVVIVSIHKREGYYTEEPMLIMILANEAFDVARKGTELRKYEWRKNVCTVHI
jgi:hypothetical protein